MAHAQTSRRRDKEIRVIAILGGSGSVGSLVVQALTDQGVDLRCVTRPKSRLFKIATPPPHVFADLDEPTSLAPALRGADTMLLITQMHPDEERRGLAAVAAAKAAGVRKIVYQSVLRRPGLDRPLHYRSKVAVEAAIQSGGFDCVIYRPNSFHQNDEFLRGAITAGVYPQPIGGVGVSRLDVRDIARAAARAVMDPAPGRFDYELHGPEPITGDQTAALYSEALGRPVQYGGDDIEAWASASRAFMADWMVDALAGMYAHFQAHGMSERPGRPPAPILPNTLISTADYVREKALHWRRPD
jgi:uncharacterized protein YbjT (DUF2867 family)